MRSCMFVLLVSLVALLACGPTSGVQGAAAATYSRKHAQRAEQMRALSAFFKLRLDTNGDNKCDKAEYQTYLSWMDPEDMPVVPWTPSVERRFAELDRDGDAALTLEEICVVLRVCREKDVQPKPDGTPSRLARVLGASTTTPAQVHLALTSDFSSMLVSWAQDAAAAGVQWDIVSHATDGAYANQAQGTSTTYSVEESGMSYTSLPLYTAAMTDLNASELVFYRVGNDQDGWSPEYSFVSMPDPRMPQLPGTMSNFIVLGDMGTSIPMGATVCKWLEAELAANPIYNMTLHVGDLAYAGVNSHGEWEPTWDAWMSQISPIASQMPYVVPVGNHEKYFNYTSYLHRFTMPSEGSQGLLNFWFSFDYDSIHFSSISTENDTTPGTEMYEWLLADWEAATARPNPPTWIVLMCHRPLYSSDESEWATHAPGSKFLTDLEPLIRKFGVHLVLTGHMHMAERTYPVFNGTVVNDTARVVQPGAAPAFMCDTTAQYDAALPLYVVNNPQAATYVVQGTAGAMQFET